MQDPRRDPDLTYSTREVAELFGVNVDTVQRWGRAGKLVRLPWPTNGFRYSAEVVERLYNERGEDDS